MLIDEVNLRISSGDGGKGCVAFNKNINSRGPTGGNGGRGGSVYFEAVSDLNALSRFRNKKEVRALNGADGRDKFRDGAGAADLVVRIPVGTMVREEKTKVFSEVTRVGQRLLIAKGGRGGRGNFLFRSATNTTPLQFEHGEAGQSLILNLEMKLIADVGIIGLPNAGKSSLLNELTKARSKVGNYPFTTLEPNLGSYYGLVIADLPGLIEDASKGKGLGHKFLRHIERTKIIFHLVACDSLDPLKDYQVVRSELAKYNPSLLEKPEYTFLSKSDLVDDETKEETLKQFERVGLRPILLSIHDPKSLNKVKEILNEVAKKSLRT